MAEIQITPKNRINFPVLYTGLFIAIDSCVANWAELCLTAIGKTQAHAYYRLAVDHHSILGHAETKNRENRNMI